LLCDMTFVMWYDLCYVKWPLLCDKYIIVYFLIQGSMRGHRIQRAKETLLLLLKSLPVECFFNVVSFGSSHNSLFDQ
jgi:hypothetical protein